MKLRITPILARAARGIAFMLVVAAGATSASERSLLEFALQPATPIPCDDTPFGRSVQVGGEFEALAFLQGSSIWEAEELQPTAPAQTPPWQRSFRTNLAGNAQIAGTTLLKAIAVDLNGDGRDEVVAAVRVSTTVVRLVVFTRSGNAFSMIDFWEVTQSSNAVDLVAGDFDGSTDKRREIALLLRVPNSGAYVYVLSGDAQGRIQQDIGQWLGRWWWPEPTVGAVSVASGDILLDGRDQAIVVAETGNSNATRGLAYAILEYQPTTAQLPIGSGSTAVGSRLFTVPFDFSFVTDDAQNPALQSIVRIDADAGDLVDTAAAELVVHLQFRSNSTESYIGQRLHRFTTTRDDNNTITSIAMGARVAGRPWDQSRIIQQGWEGTATFEAAIANIDPKPGAEIILARSDTNPRLLVSAWKVRVDPNASYTYVATGRVVRFSNTSTGEVQRYEWTFGDSTGTYTDPNPTHEFTAAGTYPVRLRATYTTGETREFTRSITVSNNGNSNGGASSAYLYYLPSAPAYEASYAVDSPQSLSFLNLAAADTNKDGLAEIMTSVRINGGAMLRSMWGLATPSQPSSFAGRHGLENDNQVGTLLGMDLVAADFDGDSAQATLDTDCRRVLEPQLRQVVWMPPYFTRLQAGADKEAVFGQSSTGGNAFEKRAGSFTSHDVSAYVGVSLDVGAVQASVKATAGYNYQSAFGALHGSENTQTIGESFAQTGGEGLVVAETNTFNCFSYAISSAATGVDTTSRMRMCEILPEQTFISGSDARRWDTEVPAAPDEHPPAQWAPLHRDWSSVSLFRPVTTNVGGSLVAANATDGLFGTAATMAASAASPYLEIDLGEVKAIAGIRVFPATGEAASLKGFRMYASASPFAGAGVPSGPSVRIFAPDTEDDAGLDRWNIWTRDRDDTDALLQARYIRLQHPGSAALRVAEIQVFGDVHVEPQFYPEAVCDPNLDDGLFKALVWNPASGPTGAFQAIDVRGMLLWNGSGTGTWPQGCTNAPEADLPQRPIWVTTNIGDSAIVRWSLSESTTTSSGRTRSFESSVRVGAEFDVEAGFIASVQAGGAYEFTSGITEETQSTSFWGAGLDMGGAIGGFQVPNTLATCRYNARPYAYKLVEKSNTGYEHTAYAVDYVVRQANGAWTRANVPAACRTITDRLFASGFE
ncbi:MAG: PKD domain-containing protein [Xanthomonadales bacterium]|nr:PKD domain-containing protein [Xanthomonadales bacterium]